MKKQLLAAQPANRFRIASNSKTFTTAAIMLLREEGLVSLTNTVAELLPEYTSSPCADGTPAAAAYYRVAKERP